MRLVALALGTEPDAKLRDSMGQYFEGGAEAQAPARAPHPATPGGSRYNWPNLAGHASLRGQTVGIVGMGEIGRALARRLGPFEVRMVYTQRRRLTSARERELGVEFRTLP